jgi:methyltransferase (TIGR00027 family)
MIEAQPSRTAFRVAMRRAAHQLLDRPLIHEDPIAIPILGPRVAEELTADPARFEVGRFAGPLRAFLALRSRVAEDALADAYRRGVRQYVVLGAGLDTFAYRCPLTGLRVFEVDFPATQAWKRERLADAHIREPATLTFVPIDFAKKRLVDALGAAGLAFDRPSFFSWLGVTPYLTPETVLATLTDLAPLAGAGGGIAFDYMVDPELLTLRQRIGVRMLGARVAAAGEPFVGFFDPAELVERMRGMGYREIRDLTPVELNATYFADRTDGLRVGGTGHMLVAEA